LLVIAGSDPYPGAAHLALAGASASGCGSLRAGVSAAMAAGLMPVLPHVVPEMDPFSAGALDRLDAVLVGPGIGAPRAATAAGGPLAESVEGWRHLQEFAGTLVVDADGLNRISSNWLKERAGATWITPHRAEFARLFPALAALPALEAAAEAAQQSGATVLLKGAHTVVAAPNGRRWQLLRSCPQAARAGLGDVLAGYAAGLAARAEACRRCDGAILALAALDHAQAGCRAVERHGAGGATPLAVAQLLAVVPVLEPARERGRAVIEADG
jgi:NAD(P)H-hydrate epimerase